RRRGLWPPRPPGGRPACGRRCRPGPRPSGRAGRAPPATSPRPRLDRTQREAPATGVTLRTVTAMPAALLEAAEAAPVPEAARRGLERVVEAPPEARGRLEADADLLDAVAWVTSASRALTRLLEADPGAL